MIRIFMFFCLFALSNVSVATSQIQGNSPSANSHNQNFLPEKNSNWEFGLGFNLGYSTTRGVIFAINPSLQYFLFDNFSLGGFIHYYTQKDLSFISAGPSATFFVLREGPYAIILNQRVRFREYIEPNGLNAAKTVSLTTLAADWKVGHNLSLRMGIGYKASLDDKTLTHNGIEKEEWIIPTFGFAYYL